MAPPAAMAYARRGLSGPSTAAAVPDSIEALPPVAPAETLGADGAVDLHCFFYESITDEDLLGAYDALMTPDERERHRRFYFERDRRLFLATRALARTTLSRYAPVAPEAWRFAAGSHGKPRVAGPEGAPAISFNLSNTHGLVVCAVSRHEPLGVDVEDLERRGETVAIADRYFAPAEVDALRKLPPGEQRARFFAYWTLKESYIKARGLGLALPLDQFAFELDRPPPIGIAFDPRLGDSPAGWRFALLAAGPRHLVAVGVACGATPLVLRASRCVPLR
jgi:4'-phosphopantetheinyl transferase